jgi:hypothetical protein
MEKRTLDLDRLLADDYLQGLAELALAEVRGRKAECAEIEVALSYLRRLVQGRLDIVDAELRRRAGGGAANLAEVVDQLPQILAGGTRPAGVGRLTTQLAPEVNLRVLTADLDRIIDVDRLGRLPEMTEHEVHAVADALAGLERTVSARRHRLHQRLDQLQAELVRRYRSGEASVDALLG